MAASLETELDRASIAHPQLGKLPLVHRLTRTEYQNAVRDLLAVDALPNEVRIDLLLPPDNISSGFDNIADLLFVSPSNMERYLDAARKIARLAVGDPAMPVLDQVPGCQVTRSFQVEHNRRALKIRRIHTHKRKGRIFFLR